jgi:hypothetical protein
MPTIAQRVSALRMLMLHSRHEVGKFNPYHHPAGTSEGGQFASADETGGETSTATPTGAQVGVHILKLTGDKKTGQELVDTINLLDKNLDGKLLPFLEQHPLKSLNVSADGKSPQALADGANGWYGWKQGGRMAVRSEKSFEWHLPGVLPGDVTTERAPSKAAAVQWAFAHELGHHVLSVALMTRGSEGRVVAHAVARLGVHESTWRRTTSRYAETSPHEYFAETFAAFHYDRGSITPRAARLVMAVLTGYELGEF